MEPALMNKLLAEFQREDIALDGARNAYLEAQLHWELALGRYRSVRDLVTAKLGASPYGPNGPKTMKDEAGNSRNLILPTRGRWRFWSIPIGDAIETVLSEATAPLTLQELVTRISKGMNGINVPPREVNGALTGKLGKTVDKVDGGDGVVRYSKGMDPDDIPF